VHALGVERGGGIGSHREAVVAAALRGAGGAAGPAGARGAEGLALKIGDDVGHETFGEGVVLDLIGNGDRTEAVIRFRDVGEKRLLLAWAPLEKL
jgi:DNA helicase-2/ATP-dependent DNA helicase PcrA